MLTLQSQFPPVSLSGGFSGGDPQSESPTRARLTASRRSNDARPGELTAQAGRVSFKSRPRPSPSRRGWRSAAAATVLTRWRLAGLLLRRPSAGFCPTRYTSGAPSPPPTFPSKCLALGSGCPTPRRKHGWARGAVEGSRVERPRRGLVRGDARPPESQSSRRERCPPPPPGGVRIQSARFGWKGQGVWRGRGA